MRGRIVIFHLPPKTPANVHKRFRKKVYGEATSSWGGKYQYRRQGILDTIRHVKLYTGVVILLPEDVEVFVDLLNEYNAVIHIRSVDLTAKDRQVLGAEGAENG